MHAHSARTVKVKRDTTLTCPSKGQTLLHQPHSLDERQTVLMPLCFSEHITIHKITLFDLLRSSQITLKCILTLRPRLPKGPGGPLCPGGPRFPDSPLRPAGPGNPGLPFGPMRGKGVKTSPGSPFCPESPHGPARPGGPCGQRWEGQQ